MDKAIIKELLTELAKAPTTAAEKFIAAQPTDEKKEEALRLCKALKIIK